MHMVTLFLSVRPHVHVWNTCVGHWEQGKNQTFGYEVTWQVARWWRSSSFPPYDGNHVSGATRAEEGMVSENTSAAASSQRLDKHHSCPWSSALLPFLSSITFLFSSCLFIPSTLCCRTSPGGLLCMCVSICEAKSRSRGIWVGFVFASRWACHNRIEYFRGPWHSVGPPVSPQPSV